MQVGEDGPSLSWTSTRTASEGGEGHLSSGGQRSKGFVVRVSIEQVVQLPVTGLTTNRGDLLTEIGRQAADDQVSETTDWMRAIIQPFEAIKPTSDG